MKKLCTKGFLCLFFICICLIGSPVLTYAKNPKNENVELTKAQFDELINTIKDLQNQVSTLQSRISGMENQYKNEVNELKINISTLKGHVDEHELNIPDKKNIKEHSQHDHDENEGLKAEASEVHLPYGDKNHFSRHIHNMKPEICFMTDMNTTYASRNNIEDRNRFNLREMELAVQSYLDPNTKINAVVAMHKHLHHHHNEEHNHEKDSKDIEVEEAYATFLKLPGGFQSKIGKFKNTVGVLNKTHTHELPQFDRPNVLVNFFGEDGLAETGINLSRTLPLPWHSNFEFEITNGENEVLLGHNRLTKPLMISHIDNIFKLTPSSTVKLGLSGAFGAREKHDDYGKYTGIQGIDFTYKWKRPESAKQFIWQTEALVAQLENPVESGKNDFWGMYSFGEYQLTKRLSGGIRYDFSEVPLSPDIKEHALSPYITFAQSEFGKWRLQYKHTFRKNGLSSDQAFLQYVFNLGSHKHDTL